MATEHTLIYGSTSISAKVSDGSTVQTMQTISFDPANQAISIDAGRTSLVFDGCYAELLFPSGSMHNGLRVNAYGASLRACDSNTQQRASVVSWPGQVAISAETPSDSSSVYANFSTSYVNIGFDGESVVQSVRMDTRGLSLTSQNGGSATPTTSLRLRTSSSTLSSTECGNQTKLSISPYDANLSILHCASPAANISLCSTMARMSMNVCPGGGNSFLAITKDAVSLMQHTNLGSQGLILSDNTARLRVAQAACISAPTVHIKSASSSAVCSLISLCPSGAEIVGDSIRLASYIGSNNCSLLVVSGRQVSARSSDATITMTPCSVSVNTSRVTVLACGSSLRLGLNHQNAGIQDSASILLDTDGPASIAIQNSDVVLSSGSETRMSTLTLHGGDASLIGNGQQIKAELYDPQAKSMEENLFGTPYSYNDGSWTKLEGTIDPATHSYSGAPNWTGFTSVFTFNEAYTLQHSNKLTFSYDIESRGAGNFVLCVAISGGDRAIVTGHGTYTNPVDQLQVGTSTHVIGSEFQNPGHNNVTATCYGYAFARCNDSEIEEITAAATLNGGLPLNQTSTITCSIEWNGSAWILTLTSSATSAKLTYSLGTDDIVLDKLALTMDGGQNTDDNGATPIVRNLQVDITPSAIAALTMDGAAKKMTLEAEELELKAKTNALISSCRSLLLRADGGLAALNLQSARTCLSAINMVFKADTCVNIFAYHNIQLESREAASITANNRICISSPNTKITGGNATINTPSTIQLISSDICLNASLINIRENGRSGHINLEDSALTFTGLQLINDYDYDPAGAISPNSHLIPTVSIVHELISSQPPSTGSELTGDQVRIVANSGIDAQVGGTKRLEMTADSTTLSAPTVSINGNNALQIAAGQITTVATGAYGALAMGSLRFERNNGSDPIQYIELSNDGTSVISDTITLAPTENTGGVARAHIKVCGNGADASGNAGYISIGAQGAVSIASKHVYVTPDCSLTLSARNNTICLSSAGIGIKSTCAVSIAACATSLRVAPAAANITTICDGAINLAVCATALHLTKGSILLGREEIGSNMPVLTLKGNPIDLVSDWERHTVNCGLIITRSYTTVGVTDGLHVEYSVSDSSYSQPSLHLMPGIISWKNDGTDTVIKNLNLTTVKARAGQYTLIDYNSNTALAIERALVPNTLVIIPWHRIAEETAFTQPTGDNNVVGASGRIVYIPNPASQNDTLPLDNLFARDSYVTIEEGALTPSIMDTQALLFKWMLLPSPVPNTGITMLVTREAIVKRDAFATTDDNFDNV